MPHRKRGEKLKKSCMMIQQVFCRHDTPASECFPSYDTSNNQAINTCSLSTGSRTFHKTSLFRRRSYGGFVVDERVQGPPLNFGRLWCCYLFCKRCRNSRVPGHFRIFNRRTCTASVLPLSLPLPPKTKTNATNIGRHVTSNTMMPRIP